MIIPPAAPSSLGASMMVEVPRDDGAAGRIAESRQDDGEAAGMADAPTEDGAAPRGIVESLNATTPREGWSKRPAATAPRR